MNIHYFWRFLLESPQFVHFLKNMLANRLEDTTRAVITRARSYSMEELSFFSVLSTPSMVLDRGSWKCLSNKSDIFRENYHTCFDFCTWFLLLVICFSFSSFPCLILDFCIIGNSLHGSDSLKDSLRLFRGII